MTSITPGRRAGGGGRPAARRAAAALALAAALGASSCSPGSQPLARVGERVITVAEFTAVAERAAAVYPGPPDSAKRLLLDDMIKREVLLEAARRRPYGAADALAGFRELVEKEVLAQAMLERLVPRDIPVAEGEVRAMHARRDREARLRLIVTFDEAPARTAREELDRGTPFAEVADRHTPSGMLPAGGDLGFMVPGTLPAPVDDWLTEAPLGATLGPVQGPDQAWYVGQVMERRPREREPFEAARSQLAEALQQRKRRLVSVRAFESLKRAYALRVEPEAARTLFARFNAPPEDTVDTQDPTLLLATYRDAAGAPLAYRLRDALADLEGSAPRPDPFRLPSIEQWIEARVMSRIVLLEARARRLHEEPEIARVVRERVEERLLDAAYQEEVVSGAQATTDDVRRAYERRLPELARLEAVRVQYLDFPDSVSAVSALQRAVGAPTLRDAILHSSAGMQVQERVIAFPTAEPEWAPYEEGLGRLEPRGYAGPVPLGGRWRILQVVEARRSRPRLEELAPETQQSLFAEADDLARERRLDQVADSLRRAYSVTVDLARLARVPWPAGGRAAEG